MHLRSIWVLKKCCVDNERKYGIQSKRLYSPKAHASLTRGVWFWKVTGKLQRFGRSIRSGWRIWEQHASSQSCNNVAGVLILGNSTQSCPHSRVSSPFLGPIESMNPTNISSENNRSSSSSHDLSPFVFLKRLCTGLGLAHIKWCHASFLRQEHMRIAREAFDSSERRKYSMKEKESLAPSKE